MISLMGQVMMTSCEGHFLNLIFIFIFIFTFTFIITILLKKAADTMKAIFDIN